MSTLAPGIRKFTENCASPRTRTTGNAHPARRATLLVAAAAELVPEIRNHVARARFRILYLFFSLLVELESVLGPLEGLPCSMDQF